MALAPPPDPTSSPDVSHEPLSETLCRRLMLSYRALGRQADAIEAYERCAALLRAERGAEPSPETRAIYERAVGEL